MQGKGVLSMESQRFRRGYVPIFLSYYKPHLRLFILDMVCALGIALVDLAFPYASRQALNTLLPQNLYGGDAVCGHLLRPHDGGPH